MKVPTLNDQAATGSVKGMDPLVTLRPAVVLILTLALASGVAIARPGFLSVDNVEFMLVDSVVLGFVALGQTVVLLGRGIDLSVAPIMGLGAALTGILATTAGLSLAVAIPLALLVGAAFGAVNAVLVAILRVPSIIATLGTLFIFQGLLFVYLDGREVTSMPREFKSFGNDEVLPHVPVPVFLLILVTAAFWLLMRKTRFGRNVYAIGGDAESARDLGVPVVFTGALTFVISGAMAAFAGLVQVSYTGYASSETGTGSHIELTAIAAAVIGGTAVTGGRGSVVGTVLATVFLSVVLAAVVFLHIPATWQAAAQGLLILMAVSVDALVGRRAELRQVASA